MKRIMVLIGVCLLMLGLAAAAEEETVTYTYDEAGRLIQADYGDGRSITYVYDNAGNLLERTVQAPDPCTLTCAGSVTPTEGLAPLDVECEIAGTTTGCSGNTSHFWDMGDGTTYTMRTHQHTYGPGVHNWSATVSIDDQTCTVTGTVTVTRIPGDCDGLGNVTIGEVQKSINMFLQTEPVSCGVDCDASGTASIGEVQKVINNFLGQQSLC